MTSSNGFDVEAVAANPSLTTATTATKSIPHHPFTTTYPAGAFTPAGQPPFPPPNPQTTGFKLNHLMLRIRSPLPSLHFYITLLGMRSVFTMNTGPFTIYYLGYPSASEQTVTNNAATPQHEVDKALQAFGQDTCARLQHTLGLLELYHVHGSESQPEGYYSSGNDPVRGLGFGHLGFTVPDVRTTLEYLRAHGVEVIKDVGSGTSTRRAVPISVQEEKLGVGVGRKGCPGDGRGEGQPVELSHEYAKVFDEIAFVKDPDGYTIELVPQRLDPLRP